MRGCAHGRSRPSPPPWAPDERCPMRRSRCAFRPEPRSAQESQRFSCRTRYDRGVKDRLSRLALRLVPILVLIRIGPLVAPALLGVARAVEDMLLLFHANALLV